MQPTTTAFEPREDLGMRVDEFDLAMNQAGFIAHRIFPIVTRNKRSGKFPRVKRDQLLQNLSVERNSEGYYPRSKREFSDDNYETKEKGLEALLDDSAQDAYDDLVDAEIFEGEVIENALLLAYEREIADYTFNATTFAGKTADVTTEWSNWASGTPATDVKNARRIVRSTLGIKPNALVINDEVLENLINSEQLVNRLKYQGFQDARPGELNAQAVAISLNIDEVIVADSMYNTKMPGVDAVLGDIWSSEFALLCRVSRTPNPNEVCLGRTVMWDKEGATAGERMGMIAETYYEEARRGGVLRRRTNWGRKTLFLEAGYLLSNITG